MIRIISVAFFALILIGAASAQITSVYTNLDEKHCKTMKPGPESNVIYNGRCRGVGGYRLNVAASDEHQWVELVAPSGKKFDVGIQPAAYDTLGKTAEWRVKDGKPIGLIVRFNLRDEYGGKVTNPLLVVSKISRAKACVTDVVKPGRTQNLEARKLADASRPCNASVRY